MENRDIIEALAELSPRVYNAIVRNEPLRKWTSLRVGGPADLFLNATDTDALAEVAALSQRCGLPLFLLGEGSNVCVGDGGMRGLLVRNACRGAVIGPTTTVETGHAFRALFVKTMRAGLAGLEFAVGIPGTVGGALVSNAGAYRGEICELVRRVEVVEDGKRKIVEPDWMGFAYRDSRLRRGGERPATLLSVTLELRPDDKGAIRRRAKDFQMQRILKQPWEPSAGSWFKNVTNRELAESLPGLPRMLKELGKIPAAFLSEACGCKGLRIGGAGVAARHANFIVNFGNATAGDIKAVADTVRARVWDRFGVWLEEEVLCVGDWSGYVSPQPACT